MTSVSTAVAGGLLAVSRLSDVPDNDLVLFGREVMLHVNNVYGVRMAGVFMISLGTIWLRTGLMPRWLAAATYLLSLTLLVVVSFRLWVTLVFPAWVMVISVYILTADRPQRIPRTDRRGRELCRPVRGDPSGRDLVAGSPRRRGPSGEHPEVEFGGERESRTGGGTDPQSVRQFGGARDQVATGREQLA